MKYETTKAEEIEKVGYFKDVTITNNSIQSLSFNYDGASYLLTVDYNGMKLSKNTDNLEDVYVVYGTRVIESALNKLQKIEVLFEKEIDAIEYLEKAKEHYNATARILKATYNNKTCRIIYPEPQKIIF